MTENSYLPSKEDALAQLELLTNGAIGRSKNQQKLLEYLLNRELPVIEGKSADYNAPKEIEIAVDVFGKSDDFNPAEDSTVRVNISNLRKKLENFYLQEGSSEKFYISIPVGSYRLAFKKNIKVTPSVVTDSSLIDNRDGENKTISLAVLNMPLVVTLLVISALINIFLGFDWYKATPKGADKVSSHTAKNHELWSDLETSTKPVMVVLGDLYNFSEFDKELNRRRTVLDPTINSDEELKQYFQKYPEVPNTTFGHRQKLITKGSSIALKNVFNLIANKQRVNYRSASEITAYHLRSFDIIYLGPIKAMGILEQYFKGSHFNIDQHKMILTNEDGSKYYPAPENMNEGYTDYGFFAKVDGPRDNKIYIISGFSDPSIMQVSWYLTNDIGLSSQEFESVINDNRLSSYNNFEIVFKVPSMDGIDIKHQIIYGGAVDSGAIWTSTE